MRYFIVLLLFIFIKDLNAGMGYILIYSLTGALIDLKAITSNTTVGCYKIQKILKNKKTGEEEIKLSIYLKEKNDLSDLKYLDDSKPENHPIKISRYYTTDSDKVAHQKQWQELKQKILETYKTDNDNVFLKKDINGINSIHTTDDNIPPIYFFSSKYSTQDTLLNKKNIDTKISENLNKNKLSALQVNFLPEKSYHTNSVLKAYKKEKIPVLVNWGDSNDNFYLGLDQYTDSFEFITSPPKYERELSFSVSGPLSQYNRLRHSNTEKSKVQHTTNK